LEVHPVQKKTKAISAVTVLLAGIVGLFLVHTLRAKAETPAPTPPVVTCWDHAPGSDTPDTCGPTSPTPTAPVPPTMVLPTPSEEQLRTMPTAPATGQIFPSTAPTPTEEGTESPTPTEEPSPVAVPTRIEAGL
jgi:hypothetical protein